MAFNTKETEIIQWGLQNGKSKDEVTKAITNFRSGVVPQPVTAPKPTVTTETPSTTAPTPDGSGMSIKQGLSDIGTGVKNFATDAFTGTVDAAKSAISGLQGDLESGAAGADQMMRKDSGVSATLEGIAKLGFRGGIGTISDMAKLLLSPITGTLGASVKNISDAVSEIPGVQNVASSKPVAAGLDTVQHLTDKLHEVEKAHPDLMKGLFDTINVLLIAAGGREPAKAGEYDALKADFGKGGDTSNTIANYDNLIKSGDYPVDRVYANPTTKVYTPEVATQVISNAKNTFIRRGFPEMATKLESSLDVNNLTPDALVSTANGLVKELGTSHGVQSAICTDIARTQADIGALKTGVQNTVKSAVDTVKGGVKNTVDAVSNIKNPLENVKIPQGVKDITTNITNDIIPSADRIVNDQVTKALDLTQGDVKNINLSTGNEVGRFMADENLIGQTRDATVQKTKAFYEKNYEDVRSEIAKVKTKYTAGEIPQYKEALTEIKKSISEVAGLQEDNAGVDALLKKKIITLNDVQRTKELLDEHFSLYKATGEVKEGRAKQGIANIRKNLQTYIEDEVKAKTGADIRKLNNNVSTSRSIIDAVEERSTRGLTRANLSASDWGALGFGTLAGGPVTGAAALLIKKVLQSPTFKLRLSSMLDKFTDAQKLKIQNQLKEGTIPPELDKIQSSVSKTENKVSSESKAKTKVATAQAPKNRNKRFIDTA